MAPAPEPAATLYPARHAALTAEADALARRGRRYGLTLTACAGLTSAAIVGALYGKLPGWTVALPLVAGGLLLRLYLRAARRRDRVVRLVDLYTAALARVDGSQPQSGHTGEEFRDPAHLYDRDLAILGPNSLFGLLATVRTGVGRRGLAHDLLQPHGREDTLARQQAVQELVPLQELRERIHLLGVSQFQQVPAGLFDAWLATPPPSFHPAFRFILIALTVALFALATAGLVHFVPWETLTPNLLGFLAAQAVIGMYLRPRVLMILDPSAKLANQTRMVRDGLALLQSTAFTSQRLIDLQGRSDGSGDAIRLLDRLHAQLIVAEQRATQWFLLASLLLNAGTHAALSIAAWKREHATAMERWLATWAEFESLSALATYAFEQPANRYPEVLPEGTALFEAIGLAHPLLGADAVPNDIALNGVRSLYLISGSNMAGKSTLLRAIGLNAVLAAAGAPVRAEQARISPLHLGASLALTDSLAEGKSKFLAEVERLHAIVQLARRPTLALFLIDEVFSGTNSLDRRVAAETVARVLVRHGAIGALSTHDLSLTEMAAYPELRALNFHMASPDPADPLAFDYRLKPGVNPESNALAILRLVGIDAGGE